MIGVLVGDENRVEGLGSDAGGIEALEGLPAGEARVNEKTGPLAGDQGAVAGARGRENRDGDDGVTLLSSMIAANWCLQGTHENRQKCFGRMNLWVHLAADTRRWTQINRFYSLSA
jgi:hypothetical protein